VKCRGMNMVNFSRWCCYCRVEQSDCLYYINIVLYGWIMHWNTM